MVLENLAEGSRLVIVVATRSHTYCFGHGDLNMVDVLMVPDRLEYRIGKAEYGDILYRFLAQIVIDAVNLLFVVHGAQTFVKCARRIEISTKGLLHDNPRVALTLVEASLAKHFGNPGIQVRGDSQIKQAVAFRAALLIQFVKALRQSPIPLPVIELQLGIKQPVGKALPKRFADAVLPC